VPFFIAVACVAVYALATLIWVEVRRVSIRFILATTALDVTAISLLVAFSGGPFSQARLAYFLIPVTAAFRFRPLFAALAGAAAALAYVVQAAAHPAVHEEGALDFILVQMGYLVWLSLAAILVSAVLERRTRRIRELAEVRRRLIRDAMTAEERGRRALAEGLHDSAIQNLLSVRHAIDEATEAQPHGALRRVDGILQQTIGELREAIFELHPYVLEQGGLVAALRTVGQHAAHEGGFRLHLELENTQRHGHEGLLLMAARELLSNVTRHAQARNVTIRLHPDDGRVVLSVADDGVGFDPAVLPTRLAEGHIGLRSHRERVESAGGSFTLRTAPGRGTTVEIALPANPQ
jgi:two-component system NarL family sensor kinase